MGETKRVYMTALTNARYIPGAMALARSLQEVKSAYALAVMIHFPGREKPWDLGESYHLRLLASMLRRGRWDRLWYKVFIWKKYRDLCRHQ